MQIVDQEIFSYHKICKSIMILKISQKLLMCKNSIKEK